MKRPQPDMDAHDDLLKERIVAWLIDTILIGIIGVVVSAGIAFSVTPSFFRGNAGPETFVFVMILVALVFTVVSFVYPIVLEGRYGQTFGKMVMNIVVVKSNGEPCDMVSSVLRNILRIIDQQPAFYIVGILMIVVTDEHQRLGDLVADTVVTKVRGTDQPVSQPDQRQVRRPQ